jgi:hypothetical protein
MRGLYVYARMVSSPLARSRALPSLSSIERRELFRDERDVDVAARVEGAFRSLADVLTTLEAYMARGRFTPKARGALALRIPEWVGEACTL